METIKNFDIECYKVSTAMIAHGGSFIKHLGKAIEAADQINKHKIRAAFPEYWVDYLEKYKYKRTQIGRAHV